MPHARRLLGLRRCFFARPPAQQSDGSPTLPEKFSTRPNEHTSYEVGALDLAIALALRDAGGRKRR